MSEQEKTTFEKYEKELEVDTSLSRFDLLDKQMRLPATKHKWIARLINHKQNLNRLKLAKDLAKEQVIEKLRDDADVIMSQAAIDKLSEKDNTIAKITKRIQDEELLILYLEKVEVMFKSLSYDVTNMVDLIKLEET